MLKKKVSSYVVIFIFYIFILFLLYPYIFIHFSTHIPFANHGDLKKIASVISYTIQSDVTEIYHLPFSYPESFTLAVTHPLFGISIFFKFFYFMGLSLEQSYNLFILLALLIGAFGCYLLIKEFVSSNLIAVLLSSFFIIYRINFLHFVWLNFLSLFYVPYIFFFFIKFFKTKKDKYIIGGVLCLFLQFISSMYYGIYIWTLIIPIFLLVSLILRITNFNEIIKISIYLIIGFFFITIIFYPYLVYGQSGVSKSFDFSLVNSLDLFSHSKLLSLFVDYSNKKSSLFFPGFIFSSFILMFFVTKLKAKKNITFLLLFLMLLVMCLTVVKPSAILDILLLIFLLLLLFLFLFTWGKRNNLEKLIFVTVAFHFILLIHTEFIPFLKNISLYYLYYQIFPVQGLRAIKRIFPILLPLFILLAAIGLENYLKEKKQLFSKKSFFLLVTFVYLFMICENIINIPKSLPIFMGKLSSKGKSEIYEKIPYNKNKILLEIPFYFQRFKGRLIGDYMLNWRFHKNALVNGRVRTSTEHFSDLKRILGKYQEKFPTEDKLKKLLHNYGASHVLFHLDLLKTNGIDENRKQKILKNIYNIKKFGNVIAKDNNNILMEVKENIPIKNIIRTYSLYHLKRNRVVVKLKERYKGKFKIFFNNVFIKEGKGNSKYFSVNFKNHTLNKSGNQIKIEFEKKVKIKNVFLAEFNKNENIPTRKITRSYSLCQLKRNRVNVSLKYRYRGRFKIFLNSMLIKEREIDNKSFSINFKNHTLNKSGNQIKIEFEKKVKIKDVFLIEFDKKK